MHKFLRQNLLFCDFVVQIEYPLINAFIAVSINQFAALSSPCDIIYMCFLYGLLYVHDRLEGWYAACLGMPDIPTF